MLDGDLEALENLGRCKVDSCPLNPRSSSVPGSGGVIKLCLLAISNLLFHNATFAESLPPVPATVSFSPTSPGIAINPAFCGLSYGKDMFTNNFLTATNTALINMFSQISPAVLRIGGDTTDLTCWNGLGGLPAITPGQIDRFAGFIKALPANWHVLYGINMSVNKPTNAAAEASYVAASLGSSLLGFEIGNECDLYHQNGIRSTNYDYAKFLPQWRALAAGITKGVPGWAITNSGHGWVLTGPSDFFDTGDYALPFAQDESNVISMLTTHYYATSADSTNATMDFLLAPDPNLPAAASNLAAAANGAKLALGARCDECGSLANAGIPGVSDGFGSALWTLDFMFTEAIHGSQGVNFHGGGDGPGYTPIAADGSIVVQARPEFYGLKMFSLAAQGSAIPAEVTLASNIDFSAYGVRQADGGIRAVLNNKATKAVLVSISLGSNVTAAGALELTGPDLDSTNGYTLGGAEIGPDGSWTGGVQYVVSATNNQIMLTVPPITAVLLTPVKTPRLDFSGTGKNGVSLVLSWTSPGFSLQASKDPCGPFIDVTNVSPYVVHTTNSQLFYRLTGC